LGKGKNEKGVEQYKTPHTGVVRYFEADRERFEGDSDSEGVVRGRKDSGEMKAR